MRLAFVAIAALSLGRVAPQPGVGVRHGNSGTRAPVSNPLGITFAVDFTDADTDAGCDFPGSQSVTINGATESEPVFEYFGGSADATDWDATYGTTASAEGSGGKFNQGSPLFGANDDSVNPNDTRSYDAGDAHDIAAEDIFAEIVFEAGSSADGDALFDKKDGADAGYRLQYNTSSELLQFVVEDSSTNTATIASGALTAGRHYVAHVFVDAGGSGQIYINSNASGAAVDVSSVGSLTNASRFGLGGNDDASGIYDSRIQCLRLWKRSGWFSTHLNATTAATRFYSIVGLIADTAAASDEPEQWDRASENQWVVNWTDSTKPSLFRVGAHWPIVERDIDSSGTTHIALRSTEGKSNQIITYTETMASGWSFTRAAKGSSGSITTPDGGSCGSGDCVIHEDATAASTHYVEQSTGAIGAGRHTLSLYCQPNGRDLIRVEAQSSEAPYQTFDCDTCALGAQGSGFATAATRDYGNWCRVIMEYDQAGAEANGFRVYVADADENISIDGLDVDSVYLWGFQFWEASNTEGELLSYVASPAATPETTALQDLYYQGDANMGQAGSPTASTIDCDVRIGYGSASTAIGSGIYASVPICPAASNSKFFRPAVYSDDQFIFSGINTVAVWDITGTTSIVDGNPHTVVGTATTDAYNLYVDGSPEGTPDTSGAMIGGITRIYVGDCWQAGISSSFLGHINSCQIHDRIVTP